MMSFSKSFFAATIVSVGLASSAQAVTFTPLPGFSDADFTAGSPSLEQSEVAVGEIRIGDNAMGGDRELGINTPPPATPVAQGNFVFTSGIGYGFDFSYVAASQTLALMLGGTSISTTSFSNIGDATDMYIRLASRDETTGTESVLVSDLAFNGGSPLGSVLSEDGARVYAQISDADFATDWSLTGTITMTGPFDRKGSNYAAQFKLVDAAAPIPLPAGLPLLAAALGGLAVLRRKTS